MAKLILFLLVSANFSNISAQEIKFLNAESLDKSNLPFSKATQVGNLLFLSGELGIDPMTGLLVKGGIKAETQQLMTNISNTLRLFHSDITLIAKCTVFLADIKEWSQFNQIYRTFFTENYPARSAVAGSGLALNARVEVECIAVVKS